MFHFLVTIAAEETPKTPTEVICLAIVGYAAAALGWIQFFLARREKRLLEKANKDARRRGVIYSPLLELVGVSDTAWIRLDDAIGMQSVRSHSGILWNNRDAVPPNYGRGEPVILLVGNSGQEAVEYKVTLDGVPIRFVPDTSGVSRVISIVYPFNPDMFGEGQTFELAFTRTDGSRDKQQYETKHGRRVLRRIDPD